MMNLRFISIVLCSLYLQLTYCKEFLCYAPVFVDTTWTDNRPDYIVNMTFGDQGAISSETTVIREVAVPVTKFNVLKTEANNPPVSLYNVETRLCDLSSAINKVPMIKKAFQTITKQSNMSLECPLKPGYYVMGNMRITSRNPIMAFMYKPKVSYTFAGGVYEEMQNRSLRPLSTYNFTLKVIKKSCKD